MVNFSSDSNLEDFSSFLSSLEGLKNNKDINPPTQIVPKQEQIITSKIVHYIATSVSLDNRIIEKIDIDYLDSEANPERLIALAHEKRIVILKGKEIKVHPEWTETFKETTVINIKNDKGEIKVLRNDIVNSDFIIKTQSREEMLAIAVLVNHVALKILEKDKKNDEKNDQKNDLLPLKNTFSYKKRNHKIDSESNKENKIHNKKDKNNEEKASKLASKLSQENTISEHSTEEKWQKQLEETIKLYRRIIIKEVLRFESKQENVKEDYIKTSIVVSDTLKKRLARD